jgi:hypothetical protein
LTGPSVTSSGNPLETTDLYLSKVKAEGRRGGRALMMP